MINNKDSGNNNTLQNVFIGLFSVAILIGIICFCVFAYFRWFKGKKYINYCTHKNGYKLIRNKKQN